VTILPNWGFSWRHLHIGILALFGVRQSVCSRGRLLLAVQEVNLRYCFPDNSLKESPSVESGSPPPTLLDIEQFL
jgi:hypothetical protein